MTEIEFKPRTHRRMLLTAANVFGDEFAFISELYSNSRDADADNFNVYLANKTIPAGENNAIFEDDGNGMSQESFQKFLDFGGTDKEGIETTKKGRPMIGKYGFGTLSINNKICKRVTFITRHEKKEIKYVRDTIDYFTKKGYMDDEPIKAEISQTTKLNGTTIILEGLKVDRDTLRKEIVKRIAREFIPVTPPMEVYIDGKKVNIESKVGTAEKTLNETLPLCGQVKGTIYFTHQPTEHPGIYIFARGRNLNPDGEFIDFSKLTSPGYYRGRIYAVIQCDALDNEPDKATVATRWGFLTYSKKYIELRAFIAKAVGKVCTKLGQKKDEALAIKQEQALQEVANILADELRKKELNKIPPEFLNAANGKEKVEEGRKEGEGGQKGTGDLDENTKETRGKGTQEGTVEPTGSNRNRRGRKNLNGKAQVVIRGIRFKVELLGGEGEPEGAHDISTKTIYVNPNHRLFKLAQQLDGKRIAGNMRQHHLKVLLMEVAKILSKSGTMSEYIDNYNKVSDIDIKFKGL